MGYVTDPDGRAMFVPDQFGGSPTFGGSPPVDSSLIGAPGAPQPEPPPAPIMPEPPQDVATPPTIPGGLPSMQSPPGLPPQTPTPQPTRADYPVPVASLPTAADHRKQQLLDAKQAAFAASPEGQLAEAGARADAADAARMQAITAQRDVEVAKAGEVEAANKAAAERQAQITADNAALQQQHAKVYAEKQAHLDALNKDVDNFKLDPDKAWHDQSIAQDIGVLIGAALAGIGNALMGKGGEPNAVLQMMQAKADQAIRLQMDRRDQLKEKAGRAEHDVDRYEAFSKDKSAEIYARRSDSDRLLAQQITLAASKYAAPEAQARGADLAAQAMASSAENKEKAAQFATGAAMQKQGLALQGAGVEIQSQHLALAKDQFAWQKDKDQQQLNLEAAKLAQKAVDPKAAENLQKFGVAGVANKDGSPFVAQGTPEGVEKVREKMAATKTIVGILDEARRLRTGYTNSVAGREEWLKLQQLWGAAKAKGKDALGLGALSGDDYKILDSYLGAADPTTFLDPTSGITQARKTVLRDMNETLAAHGLDTEWTMPDIQNRPPTMSEMESNVKRLEEGQLPVRPIGSLADAMAAGREIVSNVGNPITDLGPTDRRILDSIASALQGGDAKARDFAASSLDNISRTGRGPVKEYARQLLLNNASAGVADVTDTGHAAAASTAVKPREFVPGYLPPGQR